MRTGLWWIALLLSPAPLSAQLPADLARDRADYTAWLTSSPISPLAAIARQPIGAGIRLGPPDADLPLDGIPQHRLTERGGAARLEAPAGGRTVPRGTPIRLGPYTLTVDGPAGNAVVTAFAPIRVAKQPTYYAYEPSLVFTGPLGPPERPGTVRVLAPDGLEVEAAEAGTVVVPIGGTRVRLRVLRLPTAGSEESELEIFFRDGSNGRGSYPAGRFVQLEPGPDGRFRLDFNRARNPFCAYSSAYSCPAPWRGNAIPAPVAAGERYEE
jgi:hypothetical protein